MFWLEEVRVRLAALARPRSTTTVPTRDGDPAPWATLLDVLPNAALIVDAHGTVRGVNHEARHLLGATDIPAPVSFLLRAPEVLEAIEEAAAGSAPTRVRFHERALIERWVEAYVAPFEAGGLTAGRSVLVVLHDLTQAERLERMRADFVANASHELRTPLASLSGFIETLQGPAKNDAKARGEFLALMATQAGRMSRLIDDLLSLSRIELNEHVRPGARVDLGETAARVIDGLKLLASSEGVTLALARPEAPVVIRGDGDEIARLMENLIENAIKYGGTGKRVAVTVAAEGGDAMFGVRDFGPGIAPEHLPRLTERFYRVDAGASRAKGGTGLGLALVKHIASRHGGRLTIQSTLGAGAEFTVHFDRAK